MTTLVTGASGFLGSHVTELLLERGQRPRLLVHPEHQADWVPPGGVDIRRVDLTDSGALGAALRGVDRILHCAAKTGPWGPAPEYEHVNVVGLENLVRAATAAGVQRFVHVSSITVHGNDVRGRADERGPLRPEHNPYSRSKLQGELLLRRLIQDEGAPVVIVRPGWIYGPRDSHSFARFARMIEQSKMIMIGRGNNSLPLIYVSDAALGVVLAGEVAGVVGRTYLLVNDEPVTQRDYLTAIAAEFGVRPATRRVPYRFALAAGAVAEGAGRLSRARHAPPLTRYGVQLLGGENRFVITRARSELGFSPEVGLEDGVRRSVEWYRTRDRSGDRERAPA